MTNRRTIFGSMKEEPFYKQYHGHNIRDLQKIFDEFKNKPKIWLLGDSSMDNKFFLNDYVKPLDKFKNIDFMSNPKPDIAHHLNSITDEYVTINCAVEESTIYIRNDSRLLLEQDSFAAHNLGVNDIMIISIGGNDIAFAQTPETLFNMFLLNYCNSLSTIQNEHDKVSTLKIWGLDHFIWMFRDCIRKYIENLLRHTQSINIKPRFIMVNMIYYPDVKSGNGWAEWPLKLLGYNKNPAKLQAIIRLIFKRAISDIELNGIRVIPFPMFAIMDGKDTTDYVERVEPSASGGLKLAKALYNDIMIYSGRFHCKSN